MTTQEAAEKILGMCFPVPDINAAKMIAAEIDRCVAEAVKFNDGLFQTMRETQTKVVHKMIDRARAEGRAAGMEECWKIVEDTDEDGNEGVLDTYMSQLGNASLVKSLIQKRIRAKQEQGK